MGKKKEKPESKLTHISIDRIKEPALPARIDTIEDGLEDLVTSIKKVGLIEPLIVSKSGNNFEVVAGHRRLLASQRAGVVKVPCIVSDVDAKGAETIKIHENMFRTDLNPVEEAVFIVRLIEEKKWKAKDVSKAIGKTEAFVSQRRAMMSWPPNLLRAVQDKEIKYTVARELMSIKGEANREFYIDAAIKSGANIRTVKAWVETANAPDPAPPGGSEDNSNDKDYVPPAPAKPNCWLCGEPHDFADLVTIQIDRGCAKTLQTARNEADQS